MVSQDIIGQSDYVIIMSEILDAKRPKSLLLKHVIIHIINENHTSVADSENKIYVGINSTRKGKRLS